MQNDRLLAYFMILPVVAAVLAIRIASIECVKDLDAGLLAGELQLKRCVV